MVARECAVFFFFKENIKNLLRKLSMDDSLYLEC